MRLSPKTSHESRKQPAKRSSAAVLAASIFHFGEYSIAQAKEYLAQHGVPIRPAVTPLAKYE